jgi:NAD(P)H-hydrate epimerase
VRERDAHKWNSAVRVVAGSGGMTGAAVLVAQAAQRAGAGIVVLSSPGLEAGVVEAPVEVVQRKLSSTGWAPAVHADLHRFHSLVVGPGLGREEPTLLAAASAIFDSVVPVVVDGDGLFALSWNDAGTPAFLLEREIATVLTPHDGEFTTLTGGAPAADRIASAHHLVQLTGAVVLLKGPTTIVASPDGRTRLVTNGDERLATAGTGDVLAGIVGALIARGAEPADAAAAGAWIHAEAARSLAGDGLVAGDLVGSIPTVIGRSRSVDG